jgi:hypothetical protein
LGDRVGAEEAAREPLADICVKRHERGGVGAGNRLAVSQPLVLVAGAGRVPDRVAGQVLPAAVVPVIVAAPFSVGMPVPENVIDRTVLGVLVSTISVAWRYPTALG